MTRYEYMKMFGLHGQIDRPDDPPDEKFMEAVICFCIMSRWARRLEYECIKRN